MHIDAHQHFWKYAASEFDWIDDSMKSLRRDFMPQDLQPELERNDFQGCVAVQARQSLEETDWLLGMAEKHPFILGVVGWVDLRSRNLRFQLESLSRNPKLVGIRHIVQSEPDDEFVLRPDFLRGMTMLEEFGLAYDILIYPRHLRVATELVRKFHNQRFVLDHLAKPGLRSRNTTAWLEGIRELAKLPNVFCKLSGLVTEADWQTWKPADFDFCLDTAFESFGASRLMIGSDWPVCTLAGMYSDVMNLVKDYLNKCSPDERKAVLGGNARKFWRISTCETVA